MSAQTIHCTVLTEQCHGQTDGRRDGRLDDS